MLKYISTFSGCLLLLSILVSFQSELLSGKDVYEKKCARCHGADGTKGLLGAKNLKESKIEDIKIFQIITDGKKLMPSYGKKLSDNEIKEVVAYVKSLRR